MPSLPGKSCAVCGREMTWRKAWEKNWESVKYCSDGCRKRKGDAAGTYEAEILTLLAKRARGATICPSEVARAVAPDDWRPLMEPVREAARRLVASGKLHITQGGHVVDPSTARGAIRLKLP
jgi:hypothetical protein